MTAPRPLRVVRTEEPLAAEPQILFCAVCQVSIALAELESGVARRTPRGRTFCGICATATAEERGRRRAALETEFADDAPLPANVARPAPVVRPADVVQVLDARVGELERAAFRLQAQLASLEERVDAALARPK